MKIGAGIVVYNPKKERIKANIEQILNQVDKIYIYINSIKEFNLKEYFNSEKIQYLGNNENVGLAKAMNEIMEIADKDGMEWLMTLDQDSIVPNDIIQSFKEYVSIENVGIICPNVIDKRRVYMKADTTSETSSVDVCITSASLTRIEAWKQVGKFDDNLFIDLIDNDFCKKLKLNGWQILMINKVILDQEFGDIKLKSKKEVKFILKIAKKIKNKKLAKNFSKLTYKKNVSPMRVYYTNRNVIYLNKKFKNYNGIGYSNYNCNTYFGFNICFNLASFIRGKNKMKILKAIHDGKRDGRKLKANVFKAERIDNV